MLHWRQIREGLRGIVRRPTVEARYAVTPEYFETMGIPLRSGRTFETTDDGDAPRVAIVSEALARRRLRGIDPIGQRLRIGASEWFTIVGVVADVKQESLAFEDAEAVYVPAVQWRVPDLAMTVVARGQGSAGDLAGRVRDAVEAVDNDQPIVQVATMEQLVSSSVSERKFLLTAFQAFAGSGLLLALAGIYGLMSGRVAERTREIGVRLALGATAPGVLGLILRDGLRLTALGLAIGLVGSVAAARAVGGLLFGVSPLDPFTYGAVASAFLLVALLAAGLPASVAARIRPATALRAN